MATTPSTVIDEFLRASNVQNAGTLVPKRSNINFLGATSITDDEANDATVVALPTGGGGGTTLTETSFTQPAAGALITHDGSGNPIAGVTLADPTAATVGKGLTIAGAGFYNCEGLSGSIATLRNGTSAVNAATGAIIAVGAVVSPGGLGAPQSGTALPGQVLALNPAGSFVAAGHHEVLNVLSFGVKGDGTTDDTAAIQRAVNAAYVNGAKKLVYPSVSPTGSTQYLIDKPIFYGNGGLEVEFDINASILVANNNAFESAEITDTPNALTTGVESGLTYCVMGSQTGASQLSLAGTQAASVRGWGNGNIIQTAANFTQPLLLQTATIQTTAQPVGFPASGLIYIVGGGLYIYSVIDSTHLFIELLEQFLAGEATPGSGTVTSGAAIGSGQTPGFTCAWFIDPVTDKAAGGGDDPLVWSTGACGRFGPSTAFSLTAYNDQGTAQTRVKASLNTTGSGVSTLLGTTHTLTAGIWNHIALVYDGVSTVSLYVRGVRAATATVTGTIAQGWYEQLTIGTSVFSGLNFPDRTSLTATTQSYRMAGGTIVGLPLYSGASFAPPTVVPPFLGRISQSVIDFAKVPGVGSTPAVIGPSGLNYGRGYVIAQVLNQNTGNASSTWVPQVTCAQNFIAAPHFKKYSVNLGPNPGAGGIHLSAAIGGSFEDCVVAGIGKRGFSLEGFSYLNEIIRPNITLGYDYVGLGWGVGIVGESQYVLLAGGTMTGGNWNVVCNAFAGSMMRDNWAQANGVGGALIAGSQGPYFGIHDWFFASDAGPNSAAGDFVATVMVVNIMNFLWDGGYAASGFTGAPTLLLDSCKLVRVKGVPIFPGSLVDDSHPSQGPYVSMTGQTSRVIIDCEQAGIPFVNGPIFVSANVTNGSASVQFVGNPANIAVENYLRFGTSTSRATYLLTAINYSTKVGTLHTPYVGTTLSGVGITQLGFAWMPETGQANQGPLVLAAASDTVKTIDVVKAGTMVLLINDFLDAATAEFTDTNGILSGALTMLLPLISGYTRSYYNNTPEPITFQGSTNGTSGTGGSVTVAAGKTATIFCPDSANWIRRSLDA